MGLFGGDDDDQPDAGSTNLPDVPAWDERERLAKEKEVLGFYLSSHPLAEHEKTLAAYCSHTTVEAAELKHRTEVMLGGMLSSIKFSHTKNPKPGSPSRYAMFDLEDTDGHDALHRLARAVRQLRGADQARRHRGHPRRDRQAARQRGGQPDRQRDHPAGRPRRPLHARRDGSACSKKRTARRSSNSCTKSSAAIRAIASCN